VLILYNVQKKDQQHLINNYTKLKHTVVVVGKEHHESHANCCYSGTELFVVSSGRNAAESSIHLVIAIVCVWIPKYVNK